MRAENQPEMSLNGFLLMLISFLSFMLSVKISYICGEMFYNSCTKNADLQSSCPATPEKK